MSAASQARTSAGLARCHPRGGGSNLCSLLRRGPAAASFGDFFLLDRLFYLTSRRVFDVARVHRMKKS